jgi:hypothetical protein
LPILKTHGNWTYQGQKKLFLEEKYTLEKQWFMSILDWERAVERRQETYPK